MDEKITNIVVKKERSGSKQKDEKPPRKAKSKKKEESVGESASKETPKELPKKRPQTTHKVISDKEAEEIRYPKKPKAPPVPSHKTAKRKSKSPEPSNLQVMATQSTNNDISNLVKDHPKFVKELKPVKTVKAAAKQTNSKKADIGMFEETDVIGD